MKTSIKILIPLMLISSLAGCGKAQTSFTVTWADIDGTVLELDEDVEKGTMPSFDGENPAKEGYNFVGWSPEITEVTKDITYVATYEEIPFDSRIVGTWYVYTSSNGVIPQNYSFTINEDKTMTLAKYTLAWKGLYAGFEDTHLFKFGTISFIVSYDDTKGNEGVDWGYLNANESDLGFAKATPYSKYEYSGERFPNAEVKEYLGTSIDLPVYESSFYYLDCFKSALYDDAKSADIEIRNTSIDAFRSYLKKLESAGYTFNTPLTGSEKNDTFYYAYDSTKTYSVRCIYFGEDKQADIFVYNYMGKLHEGK